MDEITNTDKDNKIIKDAKILNNKPDEGGGGGFFSHSKPLQQTITGLTT